MTIASGSEVVSGYMQKILDGLSEEPLSQEEEVELMKRVEKGDEKAKERIILANLKLVISVAKNYRSNITRLDFHDLVQVGVIGLIKAIEKFDWRRGNKFSTYAVWWIKQKMNLETYSQNRAIEIPYYKQREIKSYFSARDYLRNELGREPKLEEIAKFMDISKKELDSLLGLIPSVKSLEKKLKDKKDSDKLKDFVESKQNVNTFKRVSEKALREDIEETLSDILTEREKKVIIERFGLRDGRPKTLARISQLLEKPVTRQRVEQIRNEALEKLKENNSLQNFFEEAAD